jgi:copper chaperone CopZ
MKKITLKILLGFVLIALGNSAYATNTNFNQTDTKQYFVKTDTLTTDTFKVYGNCGMCKATIEGALKDVQGIKKAEWSTETKMMYVTYNKKQITLDDVKKRIAAVGYDTDKFKASDEVYEGLPGCCQYERPKNEQE